MRFPYGALAFVGLAACFFPDASQLVGDAAGEAGIDGDLPDAASDAQPTDAGGDADAGAPMCDPSKPFTSVAVIAELEIDDQYKATLTPDELDIWFGETLHGDAGTTTEIMHASRASRATPFGKSTVEANIAPGDVDPSVTDDGLTLYYSKFGTVGNWDLFAATRPDRASAFGIGVQLPGAIQSSSDDVGSFIAFDGSLYFASGRSGNDDIWRAASQGNGFGAPAVVTSLSSSGDEQGIALTHDGLWAYVTSNRADLGSAGSFDIFLAHRASTADDFATPVNVAEVNGSSSERADWISPDNCRLYFESSRNRTSGSSLWLAAKSP